MLDRLLPDRFILWLLAAVALAALLPVAGQDAATFDWLTYAAIFSLFFLHGARLPREALIAGITGWRLHLAILALTFIAFPAIGIALARAFPDLLSAELWTGMLYLCALPSTVQTSIAYTSVARGNVAGAVAAAAFSNLLGVFLTPFLVAAMLQAEGSDIVLGGIWRIVALLFLPFVLGHALRPLVAPRIAGVPRLTALVDKGTILLAVYGAFSAATVEGVWSRIPPAEIALLSALLAALLAFVLALAWAVGRWGGGAASHMRTAPRSCSAAR